MDFSHSSAAASAGLGSSGGTALGFSERPLSSLSSDIADAHHRSRMHTMPPTSAVGSMSPGLNPLKQCRSEMELDSRDDRRGPMKLARTDSFSCRQADLKMHMSGGSPGASLVRSNSVVSDGRLGCSPTNSCASDGALLGSDATVVSDSRQLMRSDSVVSAPAYGHQGAGRSPLAYHHQSYHYKPAGNALNMGREGVGHMSMQNIPNARAPFTTGQWAELEHQALIFKYMMAGVNVPPDLLNPIRKSVAAMNGLTSPHHAANSKFRDYPTFASHGMKLTFVGYIPPDVAHLFRVGWGAFHLGVATNADPEPGRCRRTDGKKWRCSRDVVPDQKYCERHMHRGRHRARKPTDGQATSTSPAPTASSAAAAANSSTMTASGGNRALPGGGGSNSMGGHSNLSSPTSLSPASSQGGPPQQNLGMKSFGNSNPLGGTSNSSPGSQFQMPLQQSGASALGNKDYRYLNGITPKQEMGIGGPEQLLFSETSGSARLGGGGGGQDSPSMSNLSRLSTVSNNNHSWQSLSSKVPTPPQPKSAAGNTSSGSSLLHYNSPQMRSLLGGQDFGLMSENAGNQVNSISMQQQQQQQQQQHSFLNNGYGGGGGGGGGGAVEAVSVVREPEGQPLRHFFDDWPRSTRDPAALSWSDVEEERSNRSNNASTTQLSISIPVTSSDFPTSNPSSPPRGKLSLSPLKLSIMSRAGEEDHNCHQIQLNGTTDPTHMGLGVGMGLGISSHVKTISIEDQRRWIPVSWELPSLGGPLAEVLQSSTTNPRGGGGGSAGGSSCLNLLSDGWDSSPRETSPTGVLQKATFGGSSFSDSSSTSGSSPRTTTVKSAEPTGGLSSSCEQSLHNSPVLTTTTVTGSSHLSSSPSS
ncbi:hypothetical protein R1sor_016681 [Riccia sorocarpa]|uniref:Growth-regulating factor n=1 Tax=Riccia sorocarpa TaxID=122646 RepID=A0ABD3HJ19_9MARC